MPESSLYAPVRDYLLARGYTVRGEVQGCDVTAVKGDELIVVELKRSVTVGLLTQAIDRQRVTESVYVAVPAPESRSARAGWKDVRTLLRRLELGLLVVTFGAAGPRVRAEFHPLPFERKRSGRRRGAISAEIAARSGDHNVGGSTRTKLVTAYREAAVYIACCLERHGPMTPRALREMDAGAKTLDILHSNYYGWFERVDRGVYRLAEEGIAALAAFPEVVAGCRTRVESVALRAEAAECSSGPSDIGTRKARKRSSQGQAGCT